MQKNAKTVVHTSANKNFSVLLVNNTVVLTNVNIVMFSNTYSTRKAARAMFTAF